MASRQARDPSINSLYTQGAHSVAQAGYWRTSTFQRTQTSSFDERTPAAQDAKEKVSQRVDDTTETRPTYESFAASKSGVAQEKSPLMDAFEEAETDDGQDALSEEFWARRVDCPCWIFVLVVLVEMSISCDVLLARTITNLSALYKFQLAMTILRTVFLSYISVRLTGTASFYSLRNDSFEQHLMSFRKLAKRFAIFYFCLDNIFFWSVASTTTYLFLHLQSLSAWKVCSVVCFVIMEFVLSGHVRVVIAKMRWTRARVICYKLNRMYSCFAYLIVGTLVLVNGVGGAFDKDLFLLYIFTKFGFLSEIYFTISRLDRSDSMRYQYLIK